MSNRGFRHSVVQPLRKKKGVVAEVWISYTGHQVTTSRLLFTRSAVFSWASARPDDSIHHARCGGLGSMTTNSVPVFWNGTKSSNDTTPPCVRSRLHDKRSLSHSRIMCLNQNDRLRVHHRSAANKS
ncbi:unnamed protein product [Ectocarpus sp. 12 AP-2014]